MPNNTLTTHCSWTRRVRFLCLLTALMLCSQAAGARCEDALPVSISGTEHGFAAAAGEVLTFALTTPSAGILTIEAVVPGVALSEPRLEWLGDRCGLNAALPLARTASRLVVATTAAATVYVRLAAQDPGLPLAAFKLHTGFDAGLHATLEEWLARDGEDEEEIEIDPNCGVLLIPLLARDGEDEEEIEIDPNCPPILIPLLARDGEDEEEIEIDPNLPSAALCSLRSGDDHADVAACATHLEAGHPVTGRLGGGWSGDDDVFAFRLDGWRTVRAVTRGGVDTFGGLYDRRGQRLAVDDDGGEGASFRLVKTLGPGVYFIRVEGRGGAAGAYELSLETLVP